MFGDLCVPRIDEAQARPVTHFLSEMREGRGSGLAPILPIGRQERPNGDLPFAHLIGTPQVLPVPRSLRRGDSIAVEFVVRPDGLADPSSVEIIGSKDQAFARQVLRFVTESRFIPERVMGCNVLSKYNLVIKPTA